MLVGKCRHGPNESVRFLIKTFGVQTMLEPFVFLGKTQ